MYKLCKTEESCKRQALIEEVTLDLMHKKPFDEIKVSEICQYADIPRKAFYRYFDSKDGVVHAILDHNIIGYHTYTAEKRDGATRTIEGEFRAFFSFWKTKKSFLDAFEKSNLTGLLIQQSSKYSLREFLNARKFLSDEDDDMASKVFNFAVCGLMSIMLSWYREGFSDSIDSRAGVAARLVSKPLFSMLEKHGIATNRS